MLPCDERVIDAVNEALLLARLDPGKVVPNPRARVPPFCPVIPVAPPGSCSGVQGIRICRRVLLQENPEQCGTVVSFAYRVGFPAAMHLPAVELSTEAEVPED